MSELAFSYNGEPFEVPPGASSWRVRRIKGKGTPEVAYGRDGLPLSIPIESDMDDLRRASPTPGRYRLDAIDEQQRTIAGAPAAYVMIGEEGADLAPPATPASAAPTTDNPLIEAMRLNTDLAKSVIERFPAMMDSAAGLLRAADGAGLPAREGRAVADGNADIDDGPADAAPKAGGIQGLIEALLPSLLPLLLQMIATGKVPTGAAAVNANAHDAAPLPATATATSPPRKAHAPARAPTVTPTTTDTTPATTDTTPALDAAALAHFAAIQAALSPEDAAMARALAAELRPAELRAWLVDLGRLSVAEAVARILAVIRPPSTAIAATGGGQ